MQSRTTIWNETEHVCSAWSSSQHHSHCWPSPQEITTEKKLKQRWLKWPEMRGWWATQNWTPGGKENAEDTPEHDAGGRGMTQRYLGRQVAMLPWDETSEVIRSTHHIPTWLLLLSILREIPFLTFKSNIFLKRKTDEWNLEKLYVHSIQRRL